MHFRQLFLATALTGVLAAPLAAQEVTADTVVATVNGTEVTMGHLISLREQLPAQYQQLPDNVLYDGILDQLIQQIALGQTVTETTRRIELQIENDRRAAMAGAAVARITAEAVTDEALQAAYDARMAGVEPSKEYNAAHILLETEEEAKAVLERLAAGEEFAELAKELSTGPSGPGGGELGWVAPELLVEPFAVAMTSLEPGALSDPIQTEFGWHVIRVSEVRDTPLPTLDEMRAELSQELQTNAVEAEVQRLVEEAEVTRMTAEEIDTGALSDTALIED